MRKQLFPMGSLSVTMKKHDKAMGLDFDLARYRAACIVTHSPSLRPRLPRITAYAMKRGMIAAE
jgi:hypothetical protein